MGRKEDYLFITAFRDASLRGLLFSALDVWIFYTLGQILPSGKTLPWTSSQACWTFDKTDSGQL